MIAAERHRNAALLAWYESSEIDYPWRDAGDPYAVLVSETMLQQTQAARVAPRFERFMARFPTVGELAVASPRDVLEEWSGLGYNNRALRLHAAARRVAAEGWPDDLTELPGVGPYTAAALGAFAFGRQEAAVDTNLRRVISRWEGRPLDGRELLARATTLMPPEASAWNQAMMDLGATICTARSPRCDDCPVATWCAGPDGYLPPRRQAAFSGSNRQARGAIVRALLGGALGISGLIEVTGLERSRLEAAAGQLCDEGLVEPYGSDGYALVGEGKSSGKNV